ncbi:ABC transporter ATP-binding protein [Roseburia hominis]|uniref:ABC transporter ATP-binding protein n=1 Tax=Roseburia hominis TaxID=301301 RepID=UPI001F3261C0|nr:ABC transporter ATP-binding protein [Roseburia hominis]
MLKILKKFFDFCSEKNRKKFYESIVLGVISAIFSALKIPAIGVLLMAILNGEITNTSIFASFGIMLLSIIGTSLIKSKSNMLQTEAGYETCADKRMEIAEHMRYLPMGYFNANSLGYITSVTTNTMESLSDVATRVVMMVTEGAFTTLVITVMIFSFDVKIGLLVVLGIAVYLLANTLLQGASRKKAPEKIRSDGAVVEKVLEYIKGISEVKSYGLTGRYNQRLNQAIEDNVKANIDMELALVPYMTLQNFISKLIGVGISVLSIYLYTTGAMELLYCIMMLICSFMVTEGLEKAGTNSALLRIVDLSVDKANAILDLKPMDISGKDVKPSSYEIKADNIDFSYDKKKIIDNISLTIPEKTTTAIVGPSGGGKTTLCHLLSRFWDVDSGTVTLGGMNIKDYSMDSLMKNFSFVFQNVYLFKDTIANNIRFGQPDAPMEAVIEAAKKAKCHDFIMNLPDGYDTVIGESGGSLSGGERQRLSIARAIMKDSPIIILDEATANVDPENEKDLMEAIDELTKEKTIIMIAHRLKTVQNADQILVVDDGKIVQRGKHEQLMKEEGIYRRFVCQREQAVSWKL